MALDTLATNQRDPEAPLSSSDERHPIRRGVAKQPARKACDVFHVGLATLLPKGIRALCSCAGLFFAQFVEPCAGGELYRFRVAAQLRYFAGDDRTRNQHVREVFLTPEQAAQIFEYEQRLAGLPTCDVREIVQWHVAKVRQQQVVALSESVTEIAAHPATIPTEKNEPELGQAEPVATNAQLPVDEEAVEAEPEVVIVPLHVLQQGVAHDPALHQRIDEKTEQPYPLFRPRSKTLPRRLLQSTLWWMKCEIEETRQSLKMRLPKEEAEGLLARLCVLSRQENHLHRVLALRDVAALVNILPVYGRSRSGQVESCRIEIDVPAQKKAG